MCDGPAVVSGGSHNPDAVSSVDCPADVYLLFQEDQRCWAYNLLSWRMTEVEFWTAWRPDQTDEPPGAATEVDGCLAGS